MKSAARQFAIDVVRELRQAGYEALWAGGCVRDDLMGKTPKDYDVATNATPAQIRAVFGEKRTLSIGAAFGVITVLSGRKLAPIEVATFRRDAQYSDGRRPDHVTFSDARQDALRRDFTINGLFFDPLDNRVIDYVGGQRDLQQGVIRAIGDPHERLAEDKLRMLRGVRFAATLDFAMETQTLAAIQRHAQELTVVSAERVAAELRRMLLDARRQAAMRLLREAKLLVVIFPEWKSREDYWGETLAILGFMQDPTVAVAMAGLLRAVCLAQPDRAGCSENICRRLKLSNDEINGVSLLLSGETLIRSAMNVPWPALQRTLIHPRSDELLAYCAAVAQILDNDLSHIEFCREKLRLPAERLNPPPLISGNDLIDCGIVPGPRFRQILDRIRDEQLEGRLETASQALALARTMAEDRPGEP